MARSLRGFPFFFLFLFRLHVSFIGCLSFLLMYYYLDRLYSVAREHWYRLYPRWLDIVWQSNKRINTSFTISFFLSHSITSAGLTKLHINARNDPQYKKNSIKIIINTYGCSVKYRFYMVLNLHRERHG